MFEGFANQWTPVAFSHELKPGRTLARKIAGVPIVLFRDEGGQAHGLVDQCPHRGVALSLGTVRDGCLECPFHAWQFRGDGSCAKIPLNPMTEEKRARYHATALPFRELGGVLMVFTGLEATHEPQVGDALLRDDVVTYFYHETWTTHWTRAMENMLDTPHVPFVHRKTIGRFMRRKLKPDSRMEILLEDLPHGFRTQGVLDGNPMEGAWLDWMRPNGMVLNIPIPGKVFRQHLWCVPVDDAHTMMMLVATRNFGHYNPLVKAFDRFNRRILGEDRDIVQSSRPSEVPAPAEEISVATDRATLHFRKWYRSTLMNDPQSDATAGAARIAV